jgi:tRNA 5-methylaminomethyl-2-thiouridine biosynthesis bifunctional protein
MPHADALVIGAGLAGSSVAWSLAQRGLNVIVLEHHTKPANEASGNPAGIYMPVLEATHSLKEAFYSDALTLLQQRLAAAPEKIQHDSCGVIHLPRDEKQVLRFQRIAERDDLSEDIANPLTKTQAERLSGIQISREGLHYPNSGWVSPQSLCQYYLSHPGITLRGGVKVDQIKRQEGNWYALSSSTDILSSAPLAVLAGGHLSSAMEQAAWLPFHSVRGQITRLRLKHPHRLRCVVCHQGYVLPANNHELIIGATYNRERDDYELSTTEHNQNIQALQDFLPTFAQGLDLQTELLGRVGFRSVVPGRLPLAGRLMPAQKLSHNKAPTIYEGLAITAAHASRGILSSGITGEMIASQFLGEASKYDNYMKLISPARYLPYV